MSRTQKLVLFIDGLLGAAVSCAIITSLSDCETAWALIASVMFGIAYATCEFSLAKKIGRL